MRVWLWGLKIPAAIYALIPEPSARIRVRGARSMVFRGPVHVAISRIHRQTDPAWATRAQATLALGRRSRVNLELGGWRNGTIVTKGQVTGLLDEPKW